MISLRVGGQACPSELLCQNSVTLLTDAGEGIGVTRDPKDDPLVACAVEGAADCLISGDRDLLNLSETENSRMVTPCEFAEILGHWDGAGQPVPLEPCADSPQILCQGRTNTWYRTFSSL